MSIDDYIKKVEDTLSSNDYEDAEDLYNEIYGLYGNKIEKFDLNTSDSIAKVNMVINLNFDNPNDMLPTEVDYLNDLRIILPRLKKYAEQQNSINTPTNNICKNQVNTYNGDYVNSSINISNSSVTNSEIGCKTDGDQKNKTKTIAKIISLIASIATIIGTIIAVLQVIGKK